MLYKKVLLRLPTVMQRTAEAKSSIYKKVSEGNFPKPVKIGVRSVAWIESEIDDYINSKIEASRTPENKEV